MERNLRRFFENATENVEKIDDLEVMFELSYSMFAFLRKVKDGVLSKRKSKKMAKPIFRYYALLCKSMGSDFHKLAGEVASIVKKMEKKLIDATIFDLIFVFGTEFEESTLDISSKLSLIILILKRIQIDINYIIA